MKNYKTANHPKTGKAHVVGYIGNGKYMQIINAIEIKARANDEAASRATEAWDISWCLVVAAGLRLALSVLPNDPSSETAL